MAVAAAAGQQSPVGLEALAAGHLAAVVLALLEVQPPLTPLAGAGAAAIRLVLAARAVQAS